MINSHYIRFVSSSVSKHVYFRFSDGSNLDPLVHEEQIG
jgi:hypothetical protein